MDTTLEILINYLKISPNSAKDMINFLVVLLTVPIIISYISILKYIIGISTKHILPIIGLVFVLIISGSQANEFHSPIFLNGIKVGLFLFFSVFFINYVSFSQIHKYRVHYLSKLSILSFLNYLYIFLYFLIIENIFNKNLFNSINILYSCIVLFLVCLNLYPVFNSQNSTKVIATSLEIVISSVFIFIFFTIGGIIELIFNYLHLAVIILLIMNIYIANFKGLKLSEYWRFRQILTDDTEGNNKNT